MTQKHLQVLSKKVRSKVKAISINERETNKNVLRKVNFSHDRKCRFMIYIKCVLEKNWMRNVFYKKIT